jgi:cytoskeleton protein RodZ
MSEPSEVSSGAPAESGPATVQDGPSAGAMLRQAREAAGLPLEAVAAALKVPPQKLQALEADRWDLLPDAVFARALAASICRSLKIDPTTVLARLPQTAPRLSSGDQGINEPFRAPRDVPGLPAWASLSRPVVLTALALVVGALVLVLLPTLPTTGSAPESLASVPPSSVLPPPGAPVAEGEARSLVVSEPVVSGVPFAASPASASASAPAQPAATAVPMATPAVAAAPAGPVSASGSVLSFSTSADAWIKVTDVRGAVVLNKLLKPGDTAVTSGALPLSVVVGRADAVRVLVRGEVLDLAPQTRENVARFEVK